MWTFGSFGIFRKKHRNCKIQAPSYNPYLKLFIRTQLDIVPVTVFVINETIHNCYAKLLLERPSWKRCQRSRVPCQRLSWNVLEKQQRTRQFTNANHTLFGRPLWNVPVAFWTNYFFSILRHIWKGLLTAYTRSVAKQRNWKLRKDLLKSS